MNKINSCLFETTSIRKRIYYRLRLYLLQNKIHPNPNPNQWHSYHWRNDALACTKKKSAKNI